MPNKWQKKRAGAESVVYRVKSAAVHRWLACTLEAEGLPSQNLKHPRASSWWQMIEMKWLFQYKSKISQMKQPCLSGGNLSGTRVQRKTHLSSLTGGNFPVDYNVLCSFVPSRFTKRPWVKNVGSLETQLLTILLAHCLCECDHPLAPGPPTRNT